MFLVLRLQQYHENVRFEFNQNLSQIFSNSNHSKNTKPNGSLEHSFYLQSGSVCFCVWQGLYHRDISMVYTPSHSSQNAIFCSHYEIAQLQPTIRYIDVSVTMSYPS